MPRGPGRPPTYPPGHKYATGVAAVQKLTPRTRKAIALYGTGAARTQKEASTIAGLHPQYLSMLINGNVVAKQELKRIIEEVDTANIDMGKLLHALSVKAVEQIASTMTEASTERLRFEAAKDLADRGPQTTKVQRHQVESFTLTAEVGKTLADAMVEAALVRGTYKHMAQGSHDATGVSTPEGVDVSG